MNNSNKTCPHTASIPDGIGGYLRPEDCVLIHAPLNTKNKDDYDSKTIQP
jgi:hypothetical protein